MSIIRVRGRGWMRCLTLLKILHWELLWLANCVNLRGNFWFIGSGNQRGSGCQLVRKHNYIAKLSIFALFHRSFQILSSNNEAWIKCLIIAIVYGMCLLLNTRYMGADHLSLLLGTSFFGRSSFLIYLRYNLWGDMRQRFKGCDCGLHVRFEIGLGELMARVSLTQVLVQLILSVVGLIT